MVSAPAPFWCSSRSFGAGAGPGDPDAVPGPDCEMFSSSSAQIRTVRLLAPPAALPTGGSGAGRRGLTIITQSLSASRRAPIGARAASALWLLRTSSAKQAATEPPDDATAAPLEYNAALERF